MLKRRNIQEEEVRQGRLCLTANGNSSPTLEVGEELPQEDEHFYFITPKPILTSLIYFVSFIGAKFLFLYLLYFFNLQHIKFFIHLTINPDCI